MPKDCPKCRLVNPENSLRCDCGYNFETQQVDDNFRETEASKGGDPAEFVLYIFCVLIPLVGLIIGPIRLISKQRNWWIPLCLSLATIVLSLVLRGSNFD